MKKSQYCSLPTIFFLVVNWLYSAANPKMLDILLPVINLIIQLVLKILFYLKGYLNCIICSKLWTFFLTGGVCLYVKLHKKKRKNPAYERQSISLPMRIIAPMGGWTKNTPKPNFFEKRKKSSQTQKLKNV